MRMRCKQVASRFGVSVNCVYSWIYKGDIFEKGEVLRTRGTWLIETAAVERLEKKYQEEGDYLLMRQE